MPKPKFRDDEAQEAKRNIRGKRVGSNQLRPVRRDESAEQQKEAERKTVRDMIPQRTVIPRFMAGEERGLHILEIPDSPGRLFNYGGEISLVAYPKNLIRPKLDTALGVIAAVTPLFSDEKRYITGDSQKRGSIKPSLSGIKTFVGMPFSFFRKGEELIRFTLGLSYGNYLVADNVLLHDSSLVVQALNRWPVLDIKAGTLYIFGGGEIAVGGAAYDIKKATALMKSSGTGGLVFELPISDSVRLSAAGGYRGKSIINFLNNETIRNYSGRGEVYGRLGVAGNRFSLDITATYLVADWDGLEVNNFNLLLRPQLRL